MQFVETVDGRRRQALAGQRQSPSTRRCRSASRCIKFNHALGATGDLNFRLAVQSALDMEDIMASASPTSTRSTAPGCTRVSAYYTAAGTEKYNKPDLAAAKALLAKSSYKGETLTFITDPLRSDPDTATMVQERLKDIGIKIEI